MKNDGASVIHGLELQGRALCPVVGDTDNVTFLVGTQSLRHPNMIYRVLVRRKYSTTALDIGQRIYYVYSQLSLCQ